MEASVRQRSYIFIGILVVTLLLLLPNFAPDKFLGPKGESSWISRPISLGLDLKGGVYLMYEVQTKEAVRGRLASLIQGIRADLRNEKVAVTRATVNEQNQIEIQLLTGRNASKAKDLIDQNYRRSISFVEQRGGGEGEKATIVFQMPAEEAVRVEHDSVRQAIETLGKRVDVFGVSEPLIQRVGEDRIMLQMPGAHDIEAVKRVVGKVAQLEFKLVSEGATDDRVKLKDRDGATIEVEGTALMAGDAVAEARPGNSRGQVDVSLSLTTEGARTFRRITTENTGRRLAIILDNIVYSSPKINEPIAGGQASITGNFTFEEASELAKVLRAGALPASLKVLEERTVGPSLGAQSIQSGVLASIIGVVGIALFMISYYGKSGAVAMISIGINVAMLMAALSFFGATLTLPGLIGLALTAGMAVDANIIIYERIRDEIALGAGRDAAVAAGFHKAFSAIFDSNVSTLLAGVVLYVLGSGPILGFALTLSLGVLTTVFCATWVCRYFFDLLPLVGKRNGLSI